MPALITRSSTPFPSLFEPSMSSLMRSMMGDGLFSSSLMPSGSWIPSMDVAETNDAITLTAELPGLDDTNIKLSIENNVLTSAGEKEQEATDAPPAKAFYVSERYYGAFQRSFALPRTVDVDRVKANFDKGVLSITLPKLPQAKGRQIAIGKG